MGSEDITQPLWLPEYQPVGFEIPDSYAELDAVYGRLDYTYPPDDKSANIVVAGDWIKRNIVTVRDLPGYAKPVQVHRLVEPHLREGLRRARAARPDYVIVRLGCWVPRHKQHNRAKPLSVHSWGAAWDVNADTNRFGATVYDPARALIEPASHYDMPPEVVEAFATVGAFWGGHFKGKACDAQHFQLAYRV